MITAYALPWLPPDRDHGGPLGVVAAGEHWDAVRAPATLALRIAAALARLDYVPGALLHDPSPTADAFYWFVPKGYAHSVAAGLPVVTPLGTGSSVLLAHSSERGGRRTHWITAPEPGRWVTDPYTLRTAVADATGIELPPLLALPSLGGRLFPGQVSGQLCIWCTKDLPRAAALYPAQPRRTSVHAAPYWYPRAHPECAQ